MRRITTALLAAGVALAILPACGDRDETRDELLRHVRSSARLAMRFEYVDGRPANRFSGERAQRVAVRGIVEDDFRYKARVAYGRDDAFDEVVYDDLLAVRFIDPRKLGTFVNKEKVPEANLDTDVDDMNLVQALETRRWVVDPAGAPSRTAGSPATDKLGQDPVLDAITAMSYVERAIGEAQNVEKWNPDALNPTYSSSEDDFPKPESGSGVERFDLVRPPLPPPANFEGRSDSAVAATRHFRRMAVYVKDGTVIQVREAVNLRGRFLDDVAKWLRSFLAESDASEQELEEIDRQREEMRDASEAERDRLGLELLAGLSFGVQQIGEDPILVRTMSLDLRDVGGEVAVDLPAADEEQVKGELAILTFTDAGKEAREEESETGPTGAGETAVEPDQPDDADDADDAPPADGTDGD